MKVYGWSKGSAINRIGAGYGVGIKHRDRDRYFQRNRSSVWRSYSIAVRLSTCQKIYWITCPELRSSVFGRWMLNKGVIPRAKGKQPKFDLEPTGEWKFQLALR